MCVDNGHQGVIWSDRKKTDIKPIQIVQTFHCLTSGVSIMDLVSRGRGNPLVLVVFFETGLCNVNYGFFLYKVYS